MTKASETRPNSLTMRLALRVTTLSVRNPAREREAALYEIGRIEGDAAVGLGTGGDRQGDEVAVGVGAGQHEHRALLGR